MIDMHMHSIHSDGLFSAKELLKMAQEKNLDYISITDHDSVGAYEEIKNLDKTSLFKGKIIYGCELRFIYNGTQMEVLGYGFNYDKLKSSYWVSRNAYLELKKALLKNCLEKGKLLGLQYKNIEFNPKEKPEKTLYKELLNYPENIKIFEQYGIKHSGDFFRKFIASPESPMFFDSTNHSLNFEQAVNLIHDCGGIAILAHPFGVYNINDPKTIINELLEKNKLDGFECKHANILPEQTEYLLNLCKKHHLISTGGSDFHGYENQVFAKSNFGKDDIETPLIDNLLDKINKNNIIN